MNTEDYRKKITKLLALSKSSNRHEAYAALTKARELMAKYKFNEYDFIEEEKKTIIKNLHIKDISYSKRRDSWMSYFIEVVSKNYCCQCINYKNKNTYTFSFMGEKDDVDICADVFWYALECIRTGIKETKKKYKGYDNKSLKIASNSYAYGFIKGLKEAFDKQNQENERGWGLVMVIPREVTKYISESTTTEKFTCKQAKEIDPNEYKIGKQDGRNFTQRKRISEK